MPMIRSCVSGIDWPGLPDAWGGTVVAMLHQYRDTEWWSREKLEAHQFLQLSHVLEHFESTSPYYRQRLERTGHPMGRDITPGNLSEIPILKRTEVQDAGDALYSVAPPADHGRLHSYPTSGSTGRPVDVRFTDFQRSVHQALYTRNDLWHGRDFSKRMALLQCLRNPDEARAPYGRIEASWAKPHTTGPFSILNCADCTLSDQLDWLQQQKPAYIMSYPSNLFALARLSTERGMDMSWIGQVITFAEMLSEVQREVISNTWGVPVGETYGAAECSMIAFQCPEHEHLLVQAENVIVEILDDDDKPCSPGQTGRVVVTSLNNFAMPIIRYDLEDIAEVGSPCSSGRGLPVIEQTRGRRRDMMQLPDGLRPFPLRWSSEIGRSAPQITQYQMVQTSLSNMELRMAVTGPLAKEQERALIASIVKSLGHPFTVKLVYGDEMHRARSGKFDEFRCEMGPDSSD